MGSEKARLDVGNPSAPELRFVRQMVHDLEDLEQPLRHSAAAALCRRFVESVGLALASIQGARSAVFADDDGVTLVAHNRATKRQVSFEFKSAGQSIGVVAIDAHLRRTSEDYPADNLEALRKAIGWLASSR